MIDRLPPTPSNLNDELEAIVSSKGGLFWLEGNHQPWIHELFHTLVSRFNRHVEYAKYELYKDNPREIKFGFICSSDLKSFAYASPETDTIPFDFIGINFGVVFTLLDNFNRILSNPRTFIDIGSPHIEKENLTPIPFLSTDIMKSGFKSLSPVCPIRSIFARELTLTAIDYLFFHELTHLLNGHIEFKLRHPIDNIIYQTLEIDADAGAILHTLNHIYTLKDKFIATTRPMTPTSRAAVSATYGSTKNAVRILSYASYFVFRLIDTPMWMPHLQQFYKHPFPPIRMLYIGPTICEIFRTTPSYQYNADEFLEHHTETIKDAEIHCGLIQDKPPDPGGILRVSNSQEQVLYFKNFKKTWRKIRPDLEQYKRGRKLAE